MSARPPAGLDPRDEGSHAPGPERLWTESWYFDFATADGDLGGYVRVALQPGRGAVRYEACLVGRDRPLVTVLVDDLVPPRRHGSLELRGDGIWADHNCETPWDHWSLGLEAFGLALDDPEEVYGDDPRGERTGLAFDLEWETEEVVGPGGTELAVFRYPMGLDHVEIPCRVHGEILVGPETLELDGWGQRSHAWGVRDWWGSPSVSASGRLDDGTRFHGAQSRLPGVDWSCGYVGSRGARLEATSHVRAGLGSYAGLPPAIELTVGDLALACAPLSWSPVHLVDGDRRARVPRGLVAVRAADGRGGVGWVEIVQPG